MRAKQVCALTTTESTAKIWHQLNAFQPIECFSRKFRQRESNSF